MVNVVSLTARLENLLSEPLDSVHQREVAAFDRATEGRVDRIVLWGAGRLGRKTLAGLRQLGVEPLLFCDSNPALWGRDVDGIAVVSPEDAAGRHGSDATFVITIWGPHDRETMADRCQRLSDLGCATVVPFAPLFWQYPDVFGSYYAFQPPHRTIEQADDIRRAFNLWADEASRAEFVTQVEWRLHGDFGVLSSPVAHEIYFPEDLVDLQPGELFVDCGAYDGDTIRSLLARPALSEVGIVAFEPDPATFQQLEAYRDALAPEIRRRFELHQAAVGAVPSQLAFDPAGNEASSIGSGSLTVDCVTVDDALTGRTPTYLKMDIEGWEPEALAGARRTIASARPVLAICVYHEFDHPWRIPLAIASMSEQYRYYLRPHHLQAWDLVCYGVPAGRLKG
jgi:FkbM family methyltransferase